MPKSFAQWEAERKAALGAPAAAPPPEASSSSGPLSLPSTPSMLGNAAGSFLGPLGSLLGTTIGSSANELATSVPNLVKEVRRGGVMVGEIFAGDELCAVKRLGAGHDTGFGHWLDAALRKLRQAFPGTNRNRQASSRSSLRRCLDWKK